MNPKGVTILPSPYTVTETIDRLQAFLEAHGATIYSRIDQQSEVSKAGLQMPPLEFILFGNPKAGGPIMIENPIAALDLPLKIKPGRMPKVKSGLPITMPLLLNIGMR